MIKFLVMFPDNSINIPKDILVINLDQAHLESIVEEKLLYVLTQSMPLGTDILNRFYTPVERAIIDFSLEKYKGNQSRTAKILGLNRNTLKQKIVSYKLDIKHIKQLLMKPKDIPKNRIFLNSMSDLNLFSVCRAKLEWDNYQNTMPYKNVLNQLCYPIEIKIIHKVLNHLKGNQCRASHFLGIHRNTLKKKLDAMKSNERLSL